MKNVFVKFISGASLPVMFFVLSIVSITTTSCDDDWFDKMGCKKNKHKKDSIIIKDSTNGKDSIYTDSNGMCKRINSGAGVFVNQTLGAFVFAPDEKPEIPFTVYGNDGCAVSYFERSRKVTVDNANKMVKYEIETGVNYAGCFCTQALTPIAASVTLDKQNDVFMHNVFLTQNGKVVATLIAKY